METLVVPAPLRTKLGHDASEGLVEMFALYPQITSERFDHRLTQEIGGLRLEMHQGFAALRHEMAQIRVDVLKWSLLFWISQFTAMIGTLSYMLDGR